MLSPSPQAGKLLTLALLYALLATGSTAAADRWPLDLTPPAITGTFMEPRSKHYHSGLDIRTGGRIGVPVLAPVAGSVIRLRVAPTGYGKAIYLRADDGRVFVFAHLSAFATALQQRVTAAWAATSRYEQDLALRAGELRIEAGELLALSGATGTGAPHLHVEVRDAQGQPRNPLRFGLEFADDIAPRIEALRFVALSTDSWMAGDAIEARLAPGDTLALSGSFALELRADDYAPNAPFPLMPYRIDVELDGRAQYRLEQESFDFALAGQMRLEIRRDESGRWIRLQRRPGNELPQRVAALEDGRLRIEADGRLAELRVRATDARGNATEASFWLEGRRGEAQFAGDLRLAESWLELGDPARLRPGAHLWRVWTESDSSRVGAGRVRLPYAGLPAPPWSLQVGDGSAAWRQWARIDGVRGGEPLTTPRPLAPENSLLALDPAGSALFAGGLLASRVLSGPLAPPAELQPKGNAYELVAAGAAFAEGLRLRVAAGAPQCGLFWIDRDGWELLDPGEHADEWRLSEFGVIAQACDLTPPRIGPWRDERGGRLPEHARLRPRPPSDSGIGHPLYESVRVDLSDQGAGLDASDIEARLDGQSWPARWDPEDEYVAFDFFLDPGVGNHRLELIARDRFGNRSESAFSVLVQP